MALALAAQSNSIPAVSLLIGYGAEWMPHTAVKTLEPEARRALLAGLAEISNEQFAAHVVPLFRREPAGV